MRPSDLESKKYPIPGLSAATTPEQAAGEGGGKVQKLSVKDLRREGMTVVFDGGGHVTITTLNTENRKRWAASREKLKDGLLNQEGVHYLTKKVSRSRRGEIKVPVPGKKP
ncbi:hypothetical protein [Fluviicola sp.]|uniref:hypothetical protein n=1 Tax=Fluviicola sp. TaxID=1917219 RepID=UPI0031D5FAE3